MTTYARLKLYKNGFTLIELIVTIAIAGIVMGIGIPSFSQLIKNSRLTTNINELVTSLNLARSEAIKRGQPITIKKTGVDWESGWIIFTDVDGDGTLDAADDTLLRNYPALPNNFTLKSTYANSISYQASGISPSGTFILCENSDGNNTPEAYTSKVTEVNAVGRVRMGIDADNDGIPEKNSVEITSCTP